jgi:hypothetical protein
MDVNPTQTSKVGFSRSLNLEIIKKKLSKSKKLIKTGFLNRFRKVLGLQTMASGNF